MEMLDISTLISRFAFVFLIYVIVTTGYIAEVLSCQMRKFIMTSAYTRHIFAIMMCFVFIMMEGGWDFDNDEQNLAPTNWASGNTLHTLIMSIAIYSVFLISSKSKLIPNLVFFGTLFFLYNINTYRLYSYTRKRITDEQNNLVLCIEKTLGVFALIVLIYGFIDYYQYQKIEYGDKFSFEKFLLGASECKFEKTIQ